MSVLSVLFKEWKSKEFRSLNQIDTSEIKEEKGDLFIELNNILNETNTLKIKERLLRQYMYCTL